MGTRISLGKGEEKKTEEFYNGTDIMILYLSMQLICCQIAGTSFPPSTFNMKD